MFESHGKECYSIGEKMTTKVLRFTDKKDRYWNVYFDEVYSGNQNSFSERLGNWILGDNPEYEVLDADVEVSSLYGKQKILTLTAKQALKYIENYLDDLTDLEDF